MSNPHSLDLPSSASLVAAFIKDLANVAALLGSAQETPGRQKTRTLFYVSGAGAATFQWTADQDYFFLGCDSNTGSEVQLTTSGKALIALATKAAFDQGDVLYLTTTTTASPKPPHRDFIPAGTVLTVVIGAASSICSVVLEYA